MAGSRSRGPIGTLRNAPAIDAGTLARSSQHPGGVTDGRSYYTESPDPYYRSRGEAAAARERSRFEERRETARQQDSSYLEADIQYLLSRRTETLYKWFILLKWLREGLRKSGDSTRRALLEGIRVEAGRAQVQTHRADTEDTQAAHLMHCSLRFAYRSEQCEAYDFLQGNQPTVQDYQAFVSNLFAETANVFSIVNEIDSYLEQQGAGIELARISALVLKTGMEPPVALNRYLESYQALIQRCQNEEYPEVIRRYEAGANSLEARIAKEQSVSGDMKRHRKLSLFDVYLEQLQQNTGFERINVSAADNAYRIRHEEWGKAPNRLL